MRIETECKLTKNNLDEAHGDIVEVTQRHPKIQKRRHEEGAHEVPCGEQPKRQKKYDCRGIELHTKQSWHSLDSELFQTSDLYYCG